MSGTPNKRAHDDRYPQDEYPNMNMGGSSDYHSSSFDIGQDARMAKVPRTEMESRMYRVNESEDSRENMKESSSAYQGGGKYASSRGEDRNEDKDVYNPVRSTWNTSSSAAGGDGNQWGRVEVTTAEEEEEEEDNKEKDRKRKQQRDWGEEREKDFVAVVKEKDKTKEDVVEDENLSKQKITVLEKEKKDSDDGGGVEGEREGEGFSYGVQQRKRMLRPRGSPQVVGTRDPRFRSRPHDNDGKGDVSSHVVYRVGECMQELIKLYETSDKTSLTQGPTLEIRIPAEHVSATNRQVKGGQLWGTDIYTDDSDLVAVLMHTGYCRPTASPPPPAIQELRATVRVLPPQDCYVSTLRNNVRSRAWGAAIGCSFRVERCYIVKKGGGTIDLEACLTHTSTVEPTLAPVVVERTMTTRAAASNALRQQRFVREVTLQYNLCNEPWIKYSISAIADKGLKKPLFTSARLKKGEVLYLESRTCRYELCFNGEKMVKAAGNDIETGADGESSTSLMDVFRWSECKKPLPQTVMRAIGIPLPPDHLQVLEENLDWEDIQWSQTGVWISGKEYPISRVHFLSPV